MVIDSLSSARPGLGMFTKLITAPSSILAAPLNVVCLESISVEVLCAKCRWCEKNGFSLPAPFNREIALARPNPVSQRQNLHRLRDILCTLGKHNTVGMNFRVLQTEVRVYGGEVVRCFGEGDLVAKSGGETSALRSRNPMSVIYTVRSFCLVSQRLTQELEELRCVQTSSDDGSAAQCGTLKAARILRSKLFKLLPNPSVDCIFTPAMLWLTRMTSRSAQTMNTDGRSFENKMKKKYLNF